MSDKFYDIELGETSSDPESDSRNPFYSPPWYTDALKGACSGLIAGACTVLFGALITKMGNLVLHQTTDSIESIHVRSLFLSACMGGAMLGCVLGSLKGPCVDGSEP